MSETPERDRLVERLKGAQNFHVSWGPEADKLTPEERAAELNKIMDALEHQYDPDRFDWAAFNSKPETDLDAANRRIAWMLDDLRIVAEIVRPMLRKLSVRYDAPFTDSNALRSECCGSLDIACLHLGNHVPRPGAPKAGKPEVGTSANVTLACLDDLDHEARSDG